MGIEHATQSVSKVLPAIATSPKVSIGMPVYNGENFIREALDSLLAQTFTDFELIISDNASTDGTEGICREYAVKDKRIRYVRQAENRGATANFEFVLDKAAGEYFMWAAADDVWLSGFIETCVKLLCEDSSAQMAITGYKCVSRFSFIFNLNFPAVLDCIESKNMEDRVLSYSGKSFKTHKDNLVYSLWRRKFISDAVQNVRNGLDGKLIIGAAMNELVLLEAHGRYANKVLFHKRYRYAPPGHWAGPWLGKIGRVIRLRKAKPRPITSLGYSNAQFLNDLEALLKSRGVSDRLKDRILAANRRHIESAGAKM